MFFVIFVCSTVAQSSQSLDDASRARIERGLEYIKEQDAVRARLFKTNISDANILNYTQNIYILLKDPEKVSLVHGASHEEKEAIFKAIMASAIIHAPAEKPTYPKDEVRGEFAIIPEDPAEFPVRFGFPKFMNFSNLSDENYDYVPPQGELNKNDYDQRVMHFNILRVLTIFSQAVSRNIKYDIPIQDGFFESFDKMLKDSDVPFEAFFEWFKQSYDDHPQEREYEEHLNIIKARYSYYIKSNNEMNGWVKYRSKSSSDKYEGVDHGRNFNFNMRDAGGGGDCGYLSLGVTRAPFVEFLRTYDFPTSGASLEETVKRAYAAVHRPVPIGDLRNSLISLYEQPSTWMTLEDFTLASVAPSPLVSNRNGKPLNEQIIYVWSFLEGVSDLTLVGAFYKGDDLRTNDVLFQDLISKRTTEQHIFFNGTCHFQQLDPQ